MAEFSVAMLKSLVHLSIVANEVMKSHNLTVDSLPKTLLILQLSESLGFSCACKTFETTGEIGF